MSKPRHPRPPLRLSRLRDIGFSLWDPVGILSHGEPWIGQPAADEHDAYPASAAALLRDGMSDDACVKMRFNVETQRMGLSVRPTPEEVARIGRLIAALRLYVDEMDGP